MKRLLLCLLCLIGVYFATSILSAKDMDITKYDKNMIVRQAVENGIVWHSADDAPFVLDGFPFRKPGEPFRRLPASDPQNPLPKSVDSLANCTAGGMLRFRSDTEKVLVRVKVGGCRMDHMAFIGSMGFDLYVGGPFGKVLAGVTRLKLDQNEYTSQLLKTTKAMREYTLHFPLYSSVLSFEIGLSDGAEILPPSPWADDRPIVIYGTSIQQGGCASRPGMAHTNILSRLLNRPIINEGFSGSARGESAVAEALSKIENPAMYILDYDGNSYSGTLEDTLPVFTEILRKAHPDTPILFISITPISWTTPTLPGDPLYNETRLDIQRIHLEAYQKLRAAGDKNVHFLDGNLLFGNDYLECTVDGCHATDLGFYRMAHALYPEIARILAK